LLKKILIFQIKIIPFLLFLLYSTCVFANEQLQVIQGQKQLEDEKERLKEKEIREYPVANNSNLEEELENDNILSDYYKKIIQSSKIKEEISQINNKTKQFLNSKLSQTNFKILTNYDNLDNKRFGRNRLGANLSIINAFKNKETINFSTNINLESLNNFNYRDIIPFETSNYQRKKYNLSSNFEISLPYKDYQFAYRNQKQNYFFYNDRNSQFNAGSSNFHRFSARKLLINNENHKLFTRTSLSLRNANYYNDNILDRSTSFNSTIIGVGISQLITNKLPNFESEIFLKPTFYQGLTIFGAREDNKYYIENLSLNNQLQHNQFSILDFYGNYNLKFNLKNLVKSKNNLKLIYNSTLNSQFANKNLYANDKIGIGGFFSIRGFHSLSISGNSGYFFRNDISVNLQEISSLFAEKLLNQNSGKNYWGKNFDFGLFYDYGEIFKAHRTQKGRLSGAGILLNGKYQDLFSKNLQLNSQITVARANLYSAILQERKKEISPIVIYAKIGLNL